MPRAVKTELASTKLLLRSAEQLLITETRWRTPMASAWITTRTTSAGARRYRVEFRLGGRESRTRYAGSFKTKREADERKRWISGELAARRMPELRSVEPLSAPTLAESFE